MKKETVKYNSFMELDNKIADVLDTELAWSRKDLLKLSKKIRENIFRPTPTRRL